MNTLKAISDLTTKAAHFAAHRQSMIEQAIGEGWSYAEIGEAAGITSQRVGAIAIKAGLAGRNRGPRPRVSRRKEQPA